MLMGIPNRIRLFGWACFALLLTGVIVFSVSAQSVPLIFIEGVVSGQTVTVSGSHFPPNQSFSVRMNNYGGYGLNGVLSATAVNSGNGTFTAEIAIPAEVKDLSRIAIRLENGVYHSYNWFYNSSAGAVAGDVEKEPDEKSGKPADAPDTEQAVYTGIPSLTFEAVNGEEVTVKTGNFPPNQTFYVTMGSHGSAGTGPQVGTIVSEDGVDAPHTFTIPSRIAHYGYILVRAQTGHAENPFYTTAAFDNPSDIVVADVKDETKPKASDAPVETPDPNPVLWLGDPTMSICAVDAGKTVTIIGHNLPTNLEYTVRMNAFGTRGVGGEVVGTLSPGNNANTQLTVNIPDSLAGHGMIAIRVDAGIYYAFNYFYNNTTAPCPSE